MGRKIVRVIPWGAVAAAMLALQGCGSGGDAATWTIFVYGHGDHNLTASLDSDIQKMTEATLDGAVTVIVAADWNASEKDEDGVSYPVGTEWYRIDGDGQKTAIVEKTTTTEQNFDDPAILTDAISYAFRAYPARHYGLILWNHGGAWNGGYGGDTQNDTVERPAGLTTVQIESAVSDALSAAGLTGSAPLDFLGFDTCLLGGAEETYLWRDLSKVIIANAEIDFGSGWNYADTLTKLAADPNMTPAAFAAMEIASWEALHATASTSDELLRSHTAVDTSRLDVFAAVVKDLVDAIRATGSGGVLPGNGEVYAVASALAIPSYGMTADQGSDIARYRDFGQFLGYLISHAEDEIAAKAQIALNALVDLQIGRDYGALRDPAIAGELGFQIALPEIATIDDGLLSEYGSLAEAWSTATGWGEFLADLMAAKSSEEPNIVYGVDAPTRTGTLIPTGLALTFASMELLRDDPDSAGEKLNYGTVFFGAIASGETYEMAWDGAIWKVGSGQQEAAVLPWFYVSTPIAAAADTNSLLAAYGQVENGNPSDDAMAALLFKPGQASADSIAFSTPDGQSWEVSAIGDYAKDRPGIKFRPARLRADAAADQSPLVFGANTAEAIPTSGGMAVAMAAAPSGTYYLRATSENAWGNASESTDGDRQIVIP
ncbi:MAG TPA: clostripain-related cysteine peptidase [bacterium]|nr:clostripain-related cysteine peptidase [bacterium]